MTERDDSDEVISSYPFAEEDTSNDDDPFVCPECNREFATKRGRNIHRGQQHARTQE